MRLSKSTIDKISPPPLHNGKPKQEFYRDSALPGFGLRVTSGGKNRSLLKNASSQTLILYSEMLAYLQLLPTPSPQRFMANGYNAKNVYNLIAS